MKYIENKIDFLDFVKESDKDIQVKEIDFESIVFSMFVSQKCQNCGMYFRNYHCVIKPWFKGKEMLSKFNKFYLVYIIMDNTDRIKQLRLKSKKMVENGKRPLNEWNIKKFAVNANQSIVVNKIRRLLVGIKKRYPKERIKLFGGGGGCRSCRVCGLVKPNMTGEQRTPCAHPNKAFRAPESIGIDVYGTLKNNNIDFQVIPVEKLICVGLIAKNE